jgi:hypothetical protein
MHTYIRNIRQFVLGGAMLLPLGGLLSPALLAQEEGPPKVLVIQREYLKPGKGGMLHDRSESAFVRAFSTGEPNIHYFAMDSLSGPSRALFLSGYDSFAEWGKELTALAANKEKTAALDRASLADGDLLASYDAVAMMLRPDLSLNKGHIKGTRFFEISTFLVKPGRMQEFTELAHMYVEAYRKAAPETHWDCFQVMYGSPTAGVPAGATFVIINTMESLAETDAGILSDDKFAAALGAEGMKKADELTAASIEATSTNLFAINPRMSNPMAEWVRQDPGFWTGPVAGK